MPYVPRRGGPLRGRAVPPLLLALSGLLVATAACRGDAARVADGGAAPERHRIVCLTPSSTELVAALGATDEIVGVDVYSAYPEAVRHLPKVGDYLAPNLEAIVALHPDIVVMDDVQKQAQLPGIRVISSPMHKIADVRSGLRTLGAALGRTAIADDVVDRFDRDLERLRVEAGARRARAGRAPRVLFVVDRRPGGLGGIYAAGPDTFLHEVAELLGVDNALARSPVRYANLGAEHVVELAPDVIIELTPVADRTRARADWAALSSVPAVANGRVHVIDEPALNGPTPRLPAALERVLPLLWPSATP